MKLTPTFIFLLSISIFTACQHKHVLYVSPSGNDGLSGTKEQPVASLAKAQEIVRNTQGKVKVYLREGTYYLEKPVTFTAKDSRKTGEEVIYTAFPGEKVIISGGKRLTLSWEPYMNGIYKAKVNDKLLFDQLFVNGQLQHMARYPNYDPKAHYFGGTAADAISIERAAHWKHPEGGYVHALHKHEWGDYHYLITGKDEKGALILDGGWQNNRQMGMHDEHRFVENIFEELDAPGEWYFDAPASTLYYYPPKDIDLSAAVVVSPQCEHLFEFHGSEQNPVRNISIEQMELTHTLRTFMKTKEPLLRSDWAIYRGGAVIMEGAEHCAVRQCHFNTVGGNAVFFSNYNRNNEVSGCHIEKAGASGVCFVGDPNAVRSPSFEYNQFVTLSQIDRTPGPKSNNYPARCRVYDNLMHDLGQTEKQSTGVQISMSQDITVSHNTIYDMPRAGININEGTWGGHILEYNDVFNTVLETGDHGSFNSWGRDRFWHPNRDTLDYIVNNFRDELVKLDAMKTTIIRQNRFRCDHGWDIDLDDGSSNYYIYNNLCLNGGIKLREGAFRRVENNIMINNSFHPHVWFKNSEDVFARNVVSTGYRPIAMKGWGKEIDYNVFLDSAALVKARVDGCDMHSVYAPPAFIDASKGDYRLKEGSPAFSTGFKNFPMDQFGVVSPQLKSIAKPVPLPEFIALTSGKADEVYEFMGIRVKNVGEGERSSTGMDTERGVYVVEVSAESPFLNQLRPNDVILIYNGRTVNNLRALQEARMASKNSKNLSLKIFRNQQEQTVTVNVK